MMLEVCVDNLQSATNAVYNGADELEVCSNLAEGGLTPEFDLVREVQDMINFYDKNVSYSDKKPKINVMIRCKPGNDYLYSSNDILRMEHAIRIFKTLEVNRFVFGCLTQEKTVDQVACKKLLAAAYPKPATFHRAFDVCGDPVRAVDDIVRLGFRRLLTSGQRDSAADYLAVQLIKFLNENYGDKIEVMPGCGITVDNAHLFVDMECKIIHGTFRREQGRPEDDFYLTDGETVKHVINIIK